MVMEQFAVLFGSISIFGIGSFLVIGGLWFAIARGFTKNTTSLLELMIAIGCFGFILIFEDDRVG